MARLFDLPGTLPEPQPIRRRTADLSPDGRYRYRLTRWWDDREPATFVMLNPSVADAERDDPTIRKCVRYAQRWGYGSLVVVNLFAWRATQPENLPADEAGIAAVAVGPDNDGWLSQCALDALDSGGPLVGAWGAHATERRVADVLTLPGMGRLSCLSVTAGGQPGHPLYLRGDAQLVDWTPPGGSIQSGGGR
ncbi:DUF1643 domain-containing protein [Streptomyces sp. NPDC058155]|uniref:DUF1643 domain-containing protein n=1 Tax=Streptomyces sp. NPDC058155 TaxID=3346359 RepID=UPI0036E6D3C7